MIGPRDIAWGIVLGALLLIAAQFYPLWSAKHMVQQDAQAAFAQVFEGRRMADGTLIQPEGSVSSAKMFSAPIHFRQLEVMSSQVDWNGTHVELLLKSVIGYDRLLDELNPTHEVLVRLDKQDGGFVYRHFQVRGQEPLVLDGNPWFSVMSAALGAERNDRPTVQDRPVDHMQ